MGGKWPYIQAVITWLLVVIGWCIAVGINRKSSKRTEARQLMARAQEQIKEVEKNACAYWTEPSKTSSGVCSMSAAIQRDLKHLETTLESLYTLDITFNNSHPLRLFRQLITGDDFATADRKVLDHSNKKFNEIATVSHELISDLNKQFTTVFK